MTLTAMFAPWASIVPTVVHLAFDHHHDESPWMHRDVHDAAPVLHGHGHEDGTPTHSHDATVTSASAQAQAPSPIVHPSVSVCTAAASAADAVILDRLDPSPPQRAPIILRI